jgi:hypothetical protein
MPKTPQFMLPVKQTTQNTMVGGEQYSANPWIQQTKTIKLCYQLTVATFNDDKGYIARCR